MGSDRVFGAGLKSRNLVADPGADPLRLVDLGRSKPRVANGQLDRQRSKLDVHRSIRSRRKRLDGIGPDNPDLVRLGVGDEQLPPSGCQAADQRMILFFVKKVDREMDRPGCIIILCRGHLNHVAEKGCIEVVGIAGDGPFIRPGRPHRNASLHHFAVAIGRHRPGAFIPVRAGVARAIRRHPHRAQCVGNMMVLGTASKRVPYPARPVPEFRLFQPDLIKGRAGRIRPRAAGDKKPDLIRLLQGNGPAARVRDVCPDFSIAGFKHGKVVPASHQAQPNRTFVFEADPRAEHARLFAFFRVGNAGLPTEHILLRLQPECHHGRSGRGAGRADHEPGGDILRGLRDCDAGDEIKISCLALDAGEQALVQSLLI